MVERKMESIRGTIFTDSQFKELDKLFRSFLKVFVLAVLRKTKKEHLEKDAWMLHIAGFSQDFIARFLHTRKMTINKILKFKDLKKK